jgi:hypothetical protein
VGDSPFAFNKKADVVREAERDVTDFSKKNLKDTKFCKVC